MPLISRRVRKILAVFDDCGPGDALCLSFCMNAVRKAHPDATIDILVGERAWPVFEHAESFGRVVVSHLYVDSPRSGPMRRIRKLRELIRLAFRLGRGYDMALTFLWGTTATDALARWAARETYGYSNKIPWLLTRPLGRYPENGEPIQLAIDLLSSAGIAATPDVPYISYRRKTSLSIEGSRPLTNKLVVIHTGSDWACQQWLPNRWAAVADQLVERFGAEIVFTGVADESEYIDQIRSQMTHPSISLAGKTSVTDLTEVVARAALCLTVDVLTYELAQAVGTRIVLLAGQSRTHAVVSGPSRPIVVNRTTPELRAAILQCKTRVEKASYGGCRNYGCPMAGLRDIAIDDVLDVVARQQLLEPVTPAFLIESPA